MSFHNGPTSCPYLSHHSISNFILVVLPIMFNTAIQLAKPFSLKPFVSKVRDSLVFSLVSVAMSLCLDLPHLTNLQIVELIRLCYSALFIIVHGLSTLTLLWMKELLHSICRYSDSSGFSTELPEHNVKLPHTTRQL